MTTVLQFQSIRTRCWNSCQRYYTRS